MTMHTNYSNMQKKIKEKKNYFSLGNDATSENHKCFNEKYFLLFFKLLYNLTRINLSYVRTDK